MTQASRGKEDAMNIPGGDSHVQAQERVLRRSQMDSHLKAESIRLLHLELCENKCYLVNPAHGTLLQHPLQTDTYHF